MVETPSDPTIFPCRTTIGVANNDTVQLDRSVSGVFFRFQSKSMSPTSVYLSPEDVLRFAKVALAMADEIAEREIP